VCALVRTRSEEWRVLTADNERIVLKYLLHPHLNLRPQQLGLVQGPGEASISP